jgi:shikimate dehydrogenase
MEEGAKNQAVYGLIGRGISYSFSADYFNKRFEQEQLSARYVNFDIPDLSGLNEVLQTANLRGCNVTIPYKTAILDHLDRIDDEASEIGAVNCLKLIDQGIVGYNTDAFGFAQSLKQQLRSTDSSALVLGSTGGAAKAIIHALRGLSIQVITVSRTNDSDFTYSTLDPDLVNKTPLIINCTPLGTHPKTDQCPDLPYEVLTDAHLLFDLVYNPAESLFLKYGRQAGSRTQNGYDMLIYQAERSWEIWNTL